MFTRIRRWYRVWIESGEREAAFVRRVADEAKALGFDPDTREGMEAIVELTLRRFDERRAYTGTGTPE